VPRWSRAARWPAPGYLGPGRADCLGPGRGDAGRVRRRDRQPLGEPNDLAQFSLGVIWRPPSTNPDVYYGYGDRPWFAEYHWHGVQLLTGNAFLLGGLALLTVLIAVLAAAALRARLPSHSSTPTAPSSPIAPPPTPPLPPLPPLSTPLAPSDPRDHSDPTSPAPSTCTSS
jgi:hypothetical protein